MNEIYEILKNHVFFLATIDGNTSRVRPFGAVNIFEDKLYILTGKAKNVYAQLIKNPKIELSTMIDEGTWLRLDATVVNDDRVEAKEAFLNANPALKNMYSSTDENCAVLYFKDAEATISSFTKPPRTIKF